MIKQNNVAEEMEIDVNQEQSEDKLENVDMDESKNCDSAVDDIIIFSVNTNVSESSQNFKCKSCFKEFDSSSNLKIHMESHHEDGDWLCKKFISKQINCKASEIMSAWFIKDFRQAKIMMLILKRLLQSSLRYKTIRT